MAQLRPPSLQVGRRLSVLGKVGSWALSLFCWWRGCQPAVQPSSSQHAFRASAQVTSWCSFPRHHLPPAPCAGQLGACKEVVHRVLEHMEREAAADKRVPHFYLLDAILAVRTGLASAALAWLWRCACWLGESSPATVVWHCRRVSVAPNLSCAPPPARPTYPCPSADGSQERGGAGTGVHCGQHLPARGGRRTQPAGLPDGPQPGVGAKGESQRCRQQWSPSQVLWAYTAAGRKRIAVHRPHICSMQHAQTCPLRPPAPAPALTSPKQSKQSPALHPCLQMEKTLAGTWSVEGKRGVEPSLVQHALEELRRTIARHQSAWVDSSGPGGAAPADGPASVHGGRPSLGGAAAGGASQRSRGPSSGLTLFDEAGMWRMLRKTSLRNTLCLSFVNIKVGGWAGWWVGGWAGGWAGV